MLASLSLVSFDLGDANAEGIESQPLSEGLILNEEDFGQGESLPTAREELLEIVSGDQEISHALEDLVEPSLDLSNIEEV